ncbi:MAG: NAD(P)-dependent oxidoreductase [Legionella sp.]
MIILVDKSLPYVNELVGIEGDIIFYDSLLTLSYSPNVTALICRSTALLTADILNKFPALLYVFTASSGSDHLPIALLQEKGIAYFDAKGANAHAVTDYIQAILATLITNQLFKPKKICILGMGYVGQAVYQRLRQLDFDVDGYDPYMPAFSEHFLQKITSANMLLLHANLHHQAPFPSYHLINQAILSKLQPNTCIVNAGRGELVDESAILGFDTIHYVTDVFANEPYINADIIKKSWLVTPHIAGHSIEAKKAIMKVLSEKLHHLMGIPFKQKECHNERIRIHPENWLKETMQWYNPLIESNLLKLSSTVDETFMALRKAHTFRHEITLTTK